MTADIKIVEAQSCRSDEAFPKANFIYTGVYAYCFWDTGQSQIAAVTEQNPNSIQLTKSYWVGMYSCPPNHYSGSSV